MQRIRQVVTYSLHCLHHSLLDPRSPRPRPHESKSQHDCACPTLMRHLGPSPFEGRVGSTLTALACSRFPQFEHCWCCRCTMAGHIACLVLQQTSGQLKGRNVEAHVGGLCQWQCRVGYPTKHKFPPCAMLSAQLLRKGLQSTH